MKTLVKYKTKTSPIKAQYGKRSLTVSADSLVNLGFGDNTVQEDGKTCFLAKDQFTRLKASVKQAIRSVI
jgi:hypothetical protein